MNTTPGDHHDARRSSRRPAMNTTPGYEHDARRSSRRPAEEVTPGDEQDARNQNVQRHERQKRDSSDRKPGHSEQPN
jgi:hypothetical protein